MNLQQTEYYFYEYILETAETIELSHYFNSNLITETNFGNFSSKSNIPCSYI